MRIDFFKEGKGVSPNEPEKSRFVRFFLLYAMRFWKLVALNALFLLFCIPIVTIGPATVAMAVVLRRYSEEKLTYVWADFFTAFGACLKKALLYSALYAFAVSAAGYAAYFYLLQGQQAAWALLFFCVMLLLFLILFLSGFYAVILIGSVELTLPKIIKNSIILSVAAIRQNMLVLVCWLFGTACVTLLFPASLLLVLLLLPVTMWYSAVYILNPVVQKHCVMQDA